MKISTFFVRFAVYAAVLVGLYAVIVYDTAAGNFAAATYHDETTATEAVQELLLALMVVVGAIGIRRTAYRHIHLLLAVVALVSLIREFNNQLGDLWKIGVLAVLVPATWYFYRNFRALRAEFEEVGETYAFAIILIGGLILHVFSRFFGYSTIWQDVLGNDYVRVVARLAEEGVELLAYGIVFIGIVELYRLTRTMTRPRGASNSVSSNPTNGQDRRNRQAPVG